VLDDIEKFIKQWDKDMAPKINKQAAEAIVELRKPRELKISNGTLSREYGIEILKDSPETIYTFIEKSAHDKVVDLLKIWPSLSSTEFSYLRDLILKELGEE